MRPTSFGTLNYERISTSVSHLLRTLVKSQNSSRNDGWTFCGFSSPICDFLILVSKYWLHYLWSVWENIFLKKRLLIGHCPLLPWSKHSSRHSIPPPGLAGSARHRPLSAALSMEHQPLGTCQGTFLPHWMCPYTPFLQEPPSWFSESLWQ